MEAPANVEILDWPSSLLWKDEAGLWYSKIKPNVTGPKLSRGEESLDQLEFIYKNSGGKKICMIVESSNYSRAPKKEDRDVISARLNDVVKAMAIILVSPLSRMMAHIFFGLKPPSYPIKFFANEKEAKSWIVQYL